MKKKKKELQFIYGSKSYFWFSFLKKSSASIKRGETKN